MPRGVLSLSMWCEGLRFRYILSLFVMALWRWRANLNVPFQQRGGLDVVVVGRGAGAGAAALLVAILACRSPSCHLFKLCPPRLLSSEFFLLEFLECDVEIW